MSRKPCDAIVDVDALQLDDAAATYSIALRW
jgi:hypothetical protein